MGGRPRVKCRTAGGLVAKHLGHRGRLLHGRASDSPAAGTAKTGSTARYTAEGRRRTWSSVRWRRPLRRRVVLHPSCRRRGYPLLRCARTALGNTLTGLFFGHNPCTISVCLMIPEVSSRATSGLLQPQPRLEAILAVTCGTGVRIDSNDSTTPPRRDGTAATPRKTR